MAGLVHHQPAGVRLVAVPAAEVVGAVPHVEQPLEVHRAHLADRAVGEQLAQLLVQGVVAVVERHPHLPPGVGDRVEDLPAAGRVHGHRLLGDDVAAGPQRRVDVRGVGVVHARHHQHVDALLGEHDGQVLGPVRRHRRVAQLAEPPVVGVHPGLVDVGERDEFGGVGVVAHQRPDEHLGPGPGAHQGVSDPLTGAGRHVDRLPCCCKGLQRNNHAPRGGVNDRCQTGGIDPF